MDTNSGRTDMTKLRIPEGCSLKRKELYVYSTKHTTYEVELFENHDGTFYAIGVPKEGHRLVVYGSNVVDSADMALQILIDKIRREGIDVLFGEPEPEKSESDKDVDEESDEADE